MPNVGPVELAIVLVISLVIFGPRKLPELGRSLGSGMREFKDSVTGKDDTAEKTRGLPATAAATAQVQPSTERADEANAGMG